MLWILNVKMCRTQILWMEHGEDMYTYIQRGHAGKYAHITKNNRVFSVITQISYDMEQSNAAISLTQNTRIVKSKNGSRVSIVNSFEINE